MYYIRYEETGIFVTFRISDTAKYDWILVEVSI
jgi:hypothetical protein